MPKNWPILVDSGSGGDTIVMTVEIRKLNEDVVRLPDGSFAFSMQKALAELKRMQPNDYTVNDLLLFLLYAQKDKSIRTRTALFKEIFVIEREVFGKFLFSWNKVPGTQTTELSEFIASSLDMNWVKNAKMIKMENERRIRIYGLGKSLSIILDEAKTKAILRDDQNDTEEWRPLYSFFVREEKGKDEIEIYSRIRNIEDCEFLPYYYGPYSFHVANKLENMITLGLIESEGKKNTLAEEFRITEKGKSLIIKRFDKLPDNIKEQLQRLRKGLDQFGVDGILNYVYTYYPQFKTRSRIADRYKSITWGRGKG